MEKTNNDNILDLHDNSMSNLKWALNQPNEGMFISRGPIMYYFMGIERNRIGLACK